jgi:hypothetical protein
MNHMQTFCSKPIVITDLIQCYKNHANLSEKDKNQQTCSCWSSTPQVGWILIETLEIEFMEMNPTTIPKP